jgi:hypothetical protein
METAKSWCGSFSELICIGDAFDASSPGRAGDASFSSAAECEIYGSSGLTLSVQSRPRSSRSEDCDDAFSAVRAHSRRLLRRTPAGFPTLIQTTRYHQAFAFQRCAFDSDAGQASPMKMLHGKDQFRIQGQESEFGGPQRCLIVV